MSKYYAVKNGRIPGIYRSWAECKHQTEGYSGAVFKSFKSQSEAENFCVDREIKLELTPGTLEIFTDGSHNKTGTRMGYGIMFRYLGREYGLKRNPIIPKELTAMFGGNFESVSNPTMEFAAVAHALQITNSKFNTASQINITYDYVGSKNWLTGVWNCRKPYIKQIHSFAVRELEKLTVPINWIHVKSHTGHRENEMADSLAAGLWPVGLEAIE